MVTSYRHGALLRLSESAPFVGIQDLTHDAPVLVLAPHPDDESLGCGAAIAAASAQVTQVIIACLTDGAGSHPGSRAYPPNRLTSLRMQELTNASGILSADRARVLQFGLPDGAATFARATINHVQGILSALIKSEGVGSIWTTWEKDPHIDHICAAEIGQALQADNPSVALMRYPVWGRFTEQDIGPNELLYKFAPGAFRRTKRRAVAAHRSQMTGLISDDEGGFRMDAITQEHFISSPELFVSGRKS